MGAKILVPTDGSDASNNAIDYAAKLAKMYEGELLILNVVRTDVVTTPRQMDRDSTKKKIMEEREEAAKNIVGWSVNNAERLGVKAEGIIRYGLPDKEIVTLVVERDDIDLIVMGAYGKNFLERQIVGSKTEGVLRKMPELDVPLVVVPKLAEDIKAGGGWILVPTDGSKPSDNALEYAAEVAKLYEGELLIMNVIRKGIREGIASLKEDREEKSKEIIDKSVTLAKEKGVHAEGIMKHGFVDREIVDFAKERDDIVLLVMGAYGKNFLERQLVGSKTEAVLRAIPKIEKPLVIVPCSF